MITKIHMRSKYHIEVIAVRDILTDQIQMVPRANFVIKDSETLVVIGKASDIEKIR